MAGNKGLEDIFAKTEPEAAPTVPAEGKTVSISVGMKESEVALLDEVAARHEVARNAVMRFGLRHFLNDYLAGDVELPIETPPVKRRLKMP